jgi:hypothetical protein
MILTCFIVENIYSIITVKNKHSQKNKNKNKNQLIYQSNDSATRSDEEFQAPHVNQNL